jgi:ribosomal-protein-alanine N-acetyltransferase
LIGTLQRRASHGVAELRCGRLRLVAITPEMLVAEKDADYGELAALLGAKLTSEWPPEHWEPHVFAIILKQYDDSPQTFGWHRYVLLCDRFGMGRTLVGAVGGFLKYGGDVEIGYSTLPEFQRRGYATAFANELVGWLLSLDGVQSVSAQTFTTLPESVKVMERCGMSFVGAGDDPDTVRYRRMR